MDLNQNGDRPPQAAFGGTCPTHGLRLELSHAA
jgi:hypothetical protein